MVMLFTTVFEQGLLVLNNSPFFFSEILWKGTRRFETHRFHILWNSETSFTLNQKIRGAAKRSEGQVGLWEDVEGGPLRSETHLRRNWQQSRVLQGKWPTPRGTTTGLCWEEQEWVLAEKGPRTLDGMMKCSVSWSGWLVLKCVCMCKRLSTCVYICAGYQFIASCFCSVGGTWTRPCKRVFFSSTRLG